MGSRRIDNNADIIKILPVCGGVISWSVQRGLGGRGGLLVRALMCVSPAQVSQTDGHLAVFHSPRTHTPLERPVIM